MNKLGIETPFNVSADVAPVSFNFTQPSYYQFNEGQYIIGYTPWESTKLQDNWANLMIMCDEVWTTSDWCEQVFKDNGVTKPLKVFEHGIDHMWSPSRRVTASSRNKVLRFLHVGEPASRKGGQMVFDAFVELFGNDPSYSLTIKANGISSVRAKLPDQSIAPPDEVYNNVFLRNQLVSREQLVQIYNAHHVLVYPSWGEGFGFIPLEAMASGMPVIFNTTWAPYRRFSVGLDIADRLIDTVQENDHPGQMLEPNFESLKEQMQRAADDFETFSEQAFKFAPRIHHDYDWTRLTQKAFAPIVKKFA